MSENKPDYSEIRNALVKIRDVLIELGLTAIISELFSEIEKAPTAIFGETDERGYIISERALKVLKDKYLGGGLRVE